MQRVGGLALNDHFSIDEQVHAILADDALFIADAEWHFTVNGNATLLQLDIECVLIAPFE
jgi:hypothetical protein